MVNRIMGKLITNDDDFSISKDELKIYQPQTTIDLLEVRNFVVDKFSTLYAFTNSHKESCDGTLKLAKKKYFNEWKRGRVNFARPIETNKKDDS